MSEPPFASSRESHKSPRKICWSQSARSVPITTELPSGESSIPEKLTELKNSSRVSLGLLSAEAKNAQPTITTTTNTARLIRIGVPGGKKVYTTCDSVEANLWLGVHIRGRVPGNSFTI